VSLVRSPCYLPWLTSLLEQRGAEADLVIFNHVLIDNELLELR